MTDFQVWSVFWFMCVMCVVVWSVFWFLCVAPVKIHCLVGEGVWSMCNTMKTDRYGAWLSAVAGPTWAPSMFTTDDAWHTDMFSCWHCQRARNSLGAKESHQMMTKIIVWDCMGLSCFHWTCYTDQREKFWSWNMVNSTKPEARKRMCDRETIVSLQQSKWKRHQ